MQRVYGKKRVYLAWMMLALAGWLGGATVVQAAAQSAQLRISPDVGDPPNTNYLIRDVTISPSEAFVHYPDCTSEFTATVHYIDGSSATITNAATWSSADSSIARVDADCIAVTGIGNVDINIEYRGNTARAKLHAIGKSPILRTGQTKCYSDSGTELSSCANTGQDGELRSGQKLAGRFSVDGECVIDSLTGLIWLQPVYSPSFPLPQTYDDAEAAVDRLNRCGHTDWRIPNLNELRSLVDYGETNPALHLDQQGFTFGAAMPLAWSSTLDVSSLSMVRADYIHNYYVDLSTGKMQSMYPSANYAYAWPVAEISPGSSTLPQLSTYAAPAGSLGHWDDTPAIGKTWPFPRFVSAGNGDCLTDKLTGLTWERTPLSANKTLANAKTLVDDANANSLCGMTGWRLPNFNELASLMNLSLPKAYDLFTYQDWEYNDYVDSSEYLYEYLNNAGFSGITPDTFWSSTSYARVPAWVWTLDFSDGGDDFVDDKSHAYRLWRVRGRKEFE